MTATERALVIIALAKTLEQLEPLGRGKMCPADDAKLSDETVRAIRCRIKEYAAALTGIPN